MGVVLEHAARQMPGNGFDDVLRLAGLEQVRHYCVPEIVKPKAGEASGLPQRAPGAVPLARWLRWVVLMVLACAPQVVGRSRVAQIVSPFQHPFDRPPRSCVQRDPALTRLVLAVTDVEHSLARGALDVPHFLDRRPFAARA